MNVNEHQKDRFFVILGGEPIRPTDPVRMLEESNSMYFREAIQEVTTPYYEAIMLKASMDHGATKKIGRLWSKTYSREWELEDKNPDTNLKYSYVLTYDKDKSGVRLKTFDMSFKRRLEVEHAARLDMAFENDSVSNVRLTWFDFNPSSILAVAKDTSLESFMKEFFYKGYEHHGRLDNAPQSVLIDTSIPKIHLMEYPDYYHNVKDDPLSAYIYIGAENVFLRRFSSDEVAKKHKDRKVSLRENLSTEEYLEILKATLALIPKQEIIY